MAESNNNDKSPEKGTIIYPAGYQEHAASNGDTNAPSQGGKTEDSATGTVNTPPPSTRNKSKDSILAPRTREESSPTLLVVLVYGVLLVAAGFVGYHYMRKNNPLQRINRGTQLNIEETRALGSKQFLAVVNYNGQRMLLGVGPGFINHLCYLDASEETDGQIMSDRDLIHDGMENALHGSKKNNPSS